MTTQQNKCRTKTIIVDSFIDRYSASQPVENDKNHKWFTMSFVWSFKPIFLAYRAIFGVDLDRSKEKSNVQSCMDIFLCLFWLLCIIIPLSVNSMYLGITEELVESFVWGANLKLNYIVPGIFAIIFYISIVLSAYYKWRPLWEKLQRIQDIITDEDAFYRQLRHSSIIGLILILLVTPIFVSNYNISWLFDIYSNNHQQCKMFNIHLSIYFWSVSLR